MDTINLSTTLCSESLWNTDTPVLYPPRGVIDNEYITYNNIAYDEKNKTVYITISFGGILKWAPTTCSATLFSNYDNQGFHASAIFLKEDTLYFFIRSTFNTLISVKFFENILLTFKLFIWTHRFRAIFFCFCFNLLMILFKIHKTSFLF